MGIRCIFLGVLFAMAGAYGHPVSYEGGTALMVHLLPTHNKLSLIYSPRWWLGTGVVVEKFKEDRAYESLHLGLLIKRWNFLAAQGNIYVYGGPGRYEINSTNESATFIRLGFQMDYETRKFYIAVKYIEYRALRSSLDILDKTLGFGIGFAPYVANFKDLNSWVIFRVNVSNKLKGHAYIPTLRFFYKNFLWEVGQSLKGQSSLNFMVRY